LGVRRFTQSRIVAGAGCRDDATVMITSLGASFASARAAVARSPAELAIPPVVRGAAHAPSSRCGGSQILDSRALCNQSTFETRPSSRNTSRYRGGKFYAAISEVLTESPSTRDLSGARFAAENRDCATIEHNLQNWIGTHCPSSPSLARKVEQEKPQPPLSWL